MAMPSELHDESHTEARARTSEQPASGTHARRPPSARLHPDQEAMLLMMKVVERIEVAKSFAKLAAGLAAVTAARASDQLRSAGTAKVAAVVERQGQGTRYEGLLKVARAAAAAAVHVATNRADHGQPDTQDDDAPDTQEAPADSGAANARREAGR